MRTHHTSNRKRVIDAIFTWNGGGALCCLAVKHGFMFGINSKTSITSICDYHKRMSGHEVSFIDNPYENYNHEKHINALKHFRPKYATVLDIMSADDLTRALEQAEEISAYAENVILIPKADVTSQIPERYMLGYAVPTSYGGTDLPYSAFKNHRVHLLGGAWAQQRELIINSGMNVVSIDFNHASKIAQSGYYNDWRGNQYDIRETMPKFTHNPYYTCMTLSFAGIRAGLDDAIKNYQ